MLLRFERPCLAQGLFCFRAWVFGVVLRLLRATSIFVGPWLFVGPRFFVGRPTPRTPWLRAPTIAVRSLRSGLPRRHPRPRLRRLLRIPSGASRLLASPAPAPPCYVGLGSWRYKTCVQGRGFAGTPNCCRPGGGNRHMSCGSSRRCSLARMRGSACSWCPTTGGRRGDGRRAFTSSFSLPTRTRAAHPALEFKCRLVASPPRPHLRGPQDLKNSKSNSPTREASSSRRKTPRKLPKAARAAGRERAPQDLSLSPHRWQEPKEPHSSQRPQS